MSRHEVVVEMQMQEAVKTLYEDGNLLLEARHLNIGASSGFG
jgi:hypothetical protein